MSEHKASSAGTVENVQALRGVAAFLVLCAHVPLLIHQSTPPANGGSMGAIGVDLFFVISGFVISLTATKRHHSAGDFLLARLARVVPLYLAASLFYVTFHLLFPAESQSHPTPKAVWNGIFYLPIFDWGSYTFPPIGPGWTLSFEMCFYLMFGICLLFCSPGRTVSLFPLLFAIGAFAAIWYRGDWYLPRFLFHPYTIEFAFGCVVYQLRHHIRGVLPWILLLFAALYFGIFSLGTEELGSALGALGPDTHLAWWRVLLWGVPMALVLAGMVGLEFTRTFILPRPFVWFGGLSYSLYVIHRPLIQVLSELVPHVPIHSPWLIYGLGATVCLLAATLCYYYVELPLTSRAQKWAKQVSSPRPAKVTSAAAVISPETSASS